jgi:hypothetical protein
MKRRLLAMLTSMSALGLILGAGSAYAAAGSLDPTFGNGGIALPGGVAPPTAMIVVANGDILASSSAGANLAVRASPRTRVAGFSRPSGGPSFAAVEHGRSMQLGDERVDDHEADDQGEDA